MCFFKDEKWTVMMKNETLFPSVLRIKWALYCIIPVGFNFFKASICAPRPSPFAPRTLKQHYYPEGGWGWVVVLAACLGHPVLRIHCNNTALTRYLMILSWKNTVKTQNISGLSRVPNVLLPSCLGKTLFRHCNRNSPIHSVFECLSFGKWL